VIEVAVTLLVDRRGWMLLQERDEHAPVAPNQWGLVGGHLEEGERHGLDVARPGR
jgi:8-oxo-dGTP diphosphatase